MRILSFQSGLHDASAAAFEDYRLIAAVQEERLRREKSWGGDVPWLAIDEVLRIAGWSRNDVDVIALIRGVFPLHYFRFPLPRDVYYAVRRSLGRERLTRDLANASARTGRDSYALFRVDRFIGENGFRPDTALHFVNHHEAHALAALFHTDWDDALIYTADGIGDNVSYSIRALKDGRLECLFGGDEWLTVRRAPRNSLATAYGHATMAAGFRMWRHEGKLTGLSARGEPTLRDTLARHFRLGADGLIACDFRSWRTMQQRSFAIYKGHSRETIAASIQQLVEDLISGAVGHWLARTNARRLALAGGLFANVRLNRLLAETLPIDEIFIYPAMGDDGLAVGAALCYLRDRDGLGPWLEKRRRLDDLYFGRDYDAEIDACLAADGRIRPLAGEPVAVATGLIEAGEAGAIYVGRMEHGPRALGARSIIANPTDPTINDRLNKRLDRSEFMPFAPYVLEEDAARVFEITPVNRYAARFMTITCAVRPEWRARIPAVVHVDDTARPQIVRDADNPLFAAILRRFRDRTGVPVLINTSFNVHEEPIVNRPEECRQALIDGRVDFVVTKQAVYVMNPEAR
ncbi:MAG TPA: carbamoyltransferase C-terminal domain-containing protein [Xanthobacteraceae bacterium]|nr:carbamoyltransferase C-terminal domain-containing protein [Xanthobacteraceae bacterium]